MMGPQSIDLAESDATIMVPSVAVVAPSGDSCDTGEATTVAPAPIVAQDRSEPIANAPDTPSQGDEAFPPFLVELVDAGFLSWAVALKLVKMVRLTGKTLFRIIAEDRSLPRRDALFAWAAERAGIEHMVEERLLLSLARQEEWLRHAEGERVGAVLLAKDDTGLARYATIDPFDVDLRDWIERCSGERHRAVMVSYENFMSLTHHLMSRSEDGADISTAYVINFSPEDDRQIREHIDNIDIPQMVSYFLHRAYLRKASDIHVEPTEDRLLVRVRVDGILHEDLVMPRAAFAEVSARIKIISGMDVVEKRRPQDGRIGTVIQGVPIDVRVSTFPTVHGEKIVMRLLDKNALRPSPETLGLVERDLRLLKDKIDAPYGLIMISGPTGSGKTTTLYSCLGAIDKTSKNVMTVEDPVEYQLRGVHQMQVNHKIGVSFASGLRTILRQDPDVVMVGECRDKETASMAIQASLTGHVVFTTIHTNDSIGIVTRLIDMGVDRFMVASALTMGMAQRLVRKVCPHCQTSLPGSEVLRRILSSGVSIEKMHHLGVSIDEDMVYAHGVGCLHCHNTGYLGRTVVFEAFEMTTEARSLIMSGPKTERRGNESDSFDAEALREMMLAEGMTTLIQHGLMLVDRGITTHEEVIRVLGERV